MSLPHCGSALYPACVSAALQALPNRMCAPKVGSLDPLQTGKRLKEID
jgi:hypothetical protein